MPDTGPTRPPTLAVALRAPTGPHPAGRPVPVEVVVRNTGTRDVWIVGVLDGSEEGTRFPHYRPRVLRGDREIAVPGTPEDPLVGPLREADFRRLGPGEEFDPTRPEAGAAYLPLATFTTFTPPGPGIYGYLVTLSTESTGPDQWLGRFGQEPHRADAVRLLTRVPRLTVTSNLLEVEVTAAER